MSTYAHITRLCYAACMALLLAMLTACASQKPGAQFSKPKFETSTRSVERNGRPAVRQTWFKRAWFWQRRDARPNRGDR